MNFDPSQSESLSSPDSTEYTVIASPLEQTIAPPLPGPLEGSTSPELDTLPGPLEGSTSSSEQETLPGPLEGSTSPEQDTVLLLSEGEDNSHAQFCVSSWTDLEMEGNNNSTVIGQLRLRQRSASGQNQNVTLQPAAANGSLTQQSDGDPRTYTSYYPHGSTSGEDETQDSMVTGSSRVNGGSLTIVNGPTIERRNSESEQSDNSCQHSELTDERLHNSVDGDNRQADPSTEEGEADGDNRGFFRSLSRTFGTVNFPSLVTFTMAVIAVGFVIGVAVLKR
jgi:hypothetical protein